MQAIPVLLSHGVAIVLAILWIYLFLPVINFYYSGLPFLLCFYGLTVHVAGKIIARIFGQRQATGKRKKGPRSTFSERLKSINFRGRTGLIIFAVGLFFLIVFPYFTTAPMFYANRYRTIIGAVNESSFTQDIEPVDLARIRLIDQETAENLGDKRIGEDPALGSQAEAGVFNIQMVNDKLYWVAPLVYRGFWKWKDNTGGTHGYIMVSANDPLDVRLVQQVGGEPITLKYQPDAYFGEDLERHLFFNGYMTRGLADFTFEIDPQGRPFWVVTVFEKLVGYSGENATHVVVVDAQTGAIKEYGIEEAPGWIDRIQPEWFVEVQLSDWGAYVEGWLNSFVSENKVLEMSSSLSLVYGKDNQAYWYTGLTSSGGDQSIIGFVMVNTRTKAVNLYRLSGATEDAAMLSAEGKVQEKNYIASRPILYNVAGEPTYVCALKDKAGLIKQVAMISVKNYGILGVGENPASAFRNYSEALNAQGGKHLPGDPSSEKTVTEKVLRFRPDIRNGNAYYYLVLEKSTGTIFVGTSGISHELPLTREGDLVQIKYNDRDQKILDIAEFDNLELK